VRRLGPAIALLAVILVTALSGSAAAGPVARASKSCNVGSGRDYGTTYVTALSVRGTSCAAGKDVVRAFHACRPGKKGRCHRRVLGYSCSERRFNQIRTQYDSKVTCKKGSRVVKHTYTQWL
jgi:uncharacterized membrane protein